MAAKGRRESGALLDDAMSYVGEDGFKALIATAVEILRKNAAEGRETQQSESAIHREENARSAQADESVRQRGRDKKSARRKNAEEVIAVASIEFAPLLHPFLSEIFGLRPNDGTYYECYPWRELSYESSQIWRERLASAQTSTDDKRRIFECLLQTRQPRNIKFACETAVAEKFLEHKGSLSEHLGYYLEDVGFTLERVKFTGGGKRRGACG